MVLHVINLINILLNKGFERIIFLFLCFLLLKVNISKISLSHVHKFSVSLIARYLSTFTHLLNSNRYSGALRKVYEIANYINI